MVTGTKRGDEIYVFDSETVFALGGDDYIFYSQGSFTIHAGAGNDTVRSGIDGAFLNITGYFDAPSVTTQTAPADVVDLGAGDDILQAGGGDDRFSGGSGYDVLSYAETIFAGGHGHLNGFHDTTTKVTLSPVTLRIDLAAGTTTFAGATVNVAIISSRDAVITSASAGGLGASKQTIDGFEAVIGSQYADFISGTDRTDLTEVFEKGYYTSNDRFVGRGGTDVVSYGAANAGIVADLAARKVTGAAITPSGIEQGDFTDVLAGIEGIYGSANNDKLSGDGKGNLFNGRAGNDTIDGRGGRDTLTFDTGKFGMVAGSLISAVADGTLGVNVDLGDGTATDDFGDTDTLISIENVIGGAKDDSITGSDASNWLSGGDGDDLLQGVGGDDDLLGGDGDDRIEGGKGDDTLSGGKGADELDGGADDDVIRGGADNDRLMGGAGNDTLQGDAGADTLDGGKGKDSLDGGAKEDSLSGGADNDTLTGGAGNDTLDGGKGDDFLKDGAGADELRGGAGSDRIEAGDGADVYDGGAGQDYLSTLAAKGGIRLDLAAGTLAGKGLGLDRVQGIEHVFGTDFNDTMTGDDKANRLYGYDGKDRLAGGGGKDTLLGGAGNDRLDGGAGNDRLDGDAETTGSDSAQGKGKDTLSGGAGDDTLLGGAGADMLNGGADDDVLNGGAGDDTMIGGPGEDRFIFSTGRDVIRGFDLESDVIDVAGGDSIARFRTLEDVSAVSDDRSGSLVIKVGGSTLTILGVTFEDLRPHNFEFL